jgi:hypothetical protein
MAPEPPDNYLHNSSMLDAESPSPAPPSRISKIGIMKPLKIRDFALLWSGMTVSLIGDGIFLVAIAFQVYALSNDPGALSLVFAAWTAPMVLAFIFAGVLSDRLDRRMLMIAADVIRGLAIGIMGVMSVQGSLSLGDMYLYAALYGVGDALFMPAFTAIVPDVVPKELLVEANSLDQFVRPLTMRMIGPAAGGALIAIGDPGTALLVDAGTFVVSALCVGAMSKRYKTPVAAEKRSAFKDVAEGFRFVRSHPWLWGTLASAAIGLLFFIGPLEVLLPYVVNNDMNGDAADFGWILTVGGAGALLTSFLVGQRGLPKRHITFMYTAWGIGVFLIAMFAFTSSVWQAMIVSFCMTAMFTAGMIVWGTLMHRLVPSELLGRVSSLDWLISISLVPVSFVLTGPVANAIGTDTTLIVAGVTGSVLTFAFLLLPGIHDTEKNGALALPQEEAEAEVSLTEAELTTSA